MFCPFENVNKSVSFLESLQYCIRLTFFLFQDYHIGILRKHRRYILDPRLCASRLQQVIPNLMIHCRFTPITFFVLFSFQMVALLYCAVLLGSANTNDDLKASELRQLLMSRGDYWTTTPSANVLLISRHFSFRSFSQSASLCHRLLFPSFCVSLRPSLLEPAFLTFWAMLSSTSHCSDSSWVSFNVADQSSWICHNSLSRSLPRRPRLADLSLTSFSPKPHKIIHTLHRCASMY